MISPLEMKRTNTTYPTHSFVSLWLTCAGIFKQSMGARNRVVIGMSYRTARLHSLAELVPWNRFLDSLKVSKFGLCILYDVQKFYIPVHVDVAIFSQFRGKLWCQLSKKS